MGYHLGALLFEVLAYFFVITKTVEGAHRKLTLNYTEYHFLGVIEEIWTVYMVTIS